MSIVDIDPIRMEGLLLDAETLALLQAYRSKLGFGVCTFSGHSSTYHVDVGLEYTRDGKPCRLAGAGCSYPAAFLNIWDTIEKERAAYAQAGKPFVLRVHGKNGRSYLVGNHKGSITYYPTATTDINELPLSNGDKEKVLEFMNKLGIKEINYFFYSNQKFPHHIGFGLSCMAGSRLFQLQGSGRSLREAIKNHHEEIRSNCIGTNSLLIVETPSGKCSVSDEMHKKFLVSVNGNNELVFEPYVPKAKPAAGKNPVGTNYSVSEVSSGAEASLRSLPGGLGRSQNIIEKLFR